MTLAMIREGERVRVLAVAGQDGVRMHLGSLGFVSGAVATVVKRTAGSLIVGMHASRVALSDELARRIRVELLQER